MQAFDSIYHCHIPRTGGTFIKRHLMDVFRIQNMVADHNTPINLDLIKKSWYVAGHWGTTPIQYMNNPLVFTILRNPVDRFLSSVKYTAFMFKDKTAEELLGYWLYDERMSNLHSNTQFKFLTGELDITKYNDAVKQGSFLIQNKMLQKKPMTENNWFVTNNSKTIQDAFDFIDQNHIFFIEDIDDIIERLPKLLNIEGFKYRYPINQSPEFAVKISDEQYQRIIDLNKTDIEIYDYALKNKTML